MRARGITVSGLSRQSNNNIINSIVNNQVQIIDAKILTAHSAGFNTIDYELPSDFELNNMNKAEAQLTIYSEIIKLYMTPENMGGKGFENIRFIKPNRLIIHWNNGLTKTEREERQKIIAKICVRK